MIKADIKPFFDPSTFTWSYIVSDPASKRAAIIDSVWNYDAKAGRTDTKSADDIIHYIQKEGLSLDWILETHVHADHLSAAKYIQSKLGGKTAINRHVSAVQKIFAPLFNLEDGFPCDGSQFDQLLDDGDILNIGDLSIKALHTPGHTPACMTYVIGNNAFVGDTLFMPDYGTARCDFPGGDAGQLYQSVQKIYALGDDFQLFLCHDYLSEARDTYAFETTVEVQKRDNIHIPKGVSEAEFTAMRQARDQNLQPPSLIIPSVQVNIRGGSLPPAAKNGIHYLTVPLNSL